MSDQATQLKTSAARGAVWVFTFGLIGFPLLYVRNWFLGQVAPGGEVVGVFALVLLLQQGILTFLFFGGKNVLTTFYPKLKTDNERNGFLNYYYIFVAVATIVGIGFLLFWPEAIEWLIHGKLLNSTKQLLILLIPSTLIAYLGRSTLTAMKSFGLSAFLEHLQLFAIAILSCLFYFLAPDLLVQRPLILLGGTIVAASLFGSIISLVKIHKLIGFSKVLWLPSKGISFACFSYLEKMVIFGCMAIDQIFVLQRFDISRLGVYFLLLQVARIIPLTVQHFGHVILTTFSALLGSGNEKQVVSAYRKLSRLRVLFNFSASLLIILFARYIAAIFKCEQSYRYLIWLTINMNLGSLLTITSMCATAYEKMGPVFYARLVQVIVQIVATLALIGPLNIYGVIVGKGLGILVGSLGLFIVLALCRSHDRIYPPSVYLISQFCLIPLAIYAHVYTGNHLIATALFVFSLVGFSAIGKYRWQEFTAVINLIRGKTTR